MGARPTKLDSGGPFSSLPLGWEPFLSLLLLHRHGGRPLVYRTKICGWKGLESFVGTSFTNSVHPKCNSLMYWVGHGFTFNLNAHHCRYSTQL
ncbi:hypothetical protein GWI33_011985 [Rhynchophorus ferrugineus]|uniref:Uncharacterized protein n=1 Tax=Rhynchophorus ferrugineus TaxID=354439 RepID=A0A834MN58_RHYFE|nr:hypothetical protein GWI33_011985 [Rhynchophorus ferrugineus]